MSADHDPKPIDEMNDAELRRFLTGEGQVQQLSWTPELVLRYLRVPEDADRATVLAAARDAIDQDLLPVAAADVLAANGYPEIDPDVDAIDDGAVEDEDDLPSGFLGPDGSPF